MSIANELITRGWTQETFEDDEGRVCLMGAAGVGRRIASDLLVMNRNADALMTVLCDLEGTGDIAKYNDAPGRTFDEVLRVAKMADELLEENQ